MTGPALSDTAALPRPVQPGWRILAPLFDNRWNAALTLICLLPIAWLGPALLRWSVLDAVFAGSRDACQVASGACWAFVGDKLGFFLFGFYPAALRWRPGVAVLLVGVLIAASLWPRFWHWRLLFAWLAGTAAALLLMAGGPGLAAVPTNQWGGLPVSLMVTLAGVLGGFPLGVLLALGRRSRELPFIRWACVVWIELVRGVPLISILFMVNVMVPLFLPELLTPEKLARALLAYALAASAYFAEVVRGGLQALPDTQGQTARALGLSYWQAMRLVVLPQALRIAIPPLANTVISFIKETSLVMVIGLFDLLGTIQLAARDPAWLVTGTEGYLFAGAVYLALCAGTARYAGWLEHRLPRTV
jgi:general L-amino acid transport system permease protein